MKCPKELINYPLSVTIEGHRRKFIDKLLGDGWCCFLCSCEGVCEQFGFVKLSFWDCLSVVIFAVRFYCHYFILFYFILLQFSLLSLLYYFNIVYCVSAALIAK